MTRHEMYQYVKFKLEMLIILIKVTIYYEAVRDVVRKPWDRH